MSMILLFISPVSAKYIVSPFLSGQLVCQFSWQDALRREWLFPSQEVQHRHGDWQANLSGEPVAFRLCVIALAKGATIASELCLDPKRHRFADSTKKG